MKRRLAILGSTGSIGRSAVGVVRHHPERLEVVALAAYGRNVDRLLGQIEQLRPKLVAVRDGAVARGLSRRVPSGTRVVAGEEGIVEAATHPDVDRVLAAMVGAAGLVPVHAAVAAGKDVALANKEALVVAGRLLTDLAARRGARLLPVDSEHAALDQALRGGRREEVRRLVLTASGGPFLTRDPETWKEIRPEEALRHPTWAMGEKITIDSATLMNKGLELIEASHLFAMPAAAIDVVIHPQSIVHSLVEFTDGTCLAQMSVNDMSLPIQYALSYPERWSSRFARLSLEELGRLEFLALDEERFPAVGLARRALDAGESASAALNAANEVAVHAFLDRRISFPRIVSLVEEVLDAHEARPVGSLAEALQHDEWARREAGARLAAGARTG